jgi:hypothetical protein
LLGYLRPWAAIAALEGDALSAAARFTLSRFFVASKSWLSPKWCHLPSPTYAARVKGSTLARGEVTFGPVIAIAGALSPNRCHLPSATNVLLVEGGSPA